MLRVERDGTTPREGIEVGPGELVANVRIVVGYGNAILRGQLKIIGATMPEGTSFMVSPQRVGGNLSWGMSGQVDARGQFLIEGLMAGEYDLRVSVFNRTSPTAIDRNLMTRLSRFRQRISIANAGETLVAVIIDLSQ